MKYDTTFKDLFPDVKELFRLLTNSQVTQVENVEYASVKQRRTDLVAWLANGELLHLELQSRNDDSMLWRELEYCVLIAEHYQQIPLQIVLYVGNAPADFQTKIETTDLKYHYHLIDIKQLDCTTLLESNSLSDNLLALLGKLQDKAQAIQRIMRKIAQLPRAKRADMLEKLSILAGLRPAELPKLIQQEANMPITIDLEENPLFVEIFERHTQRGIQIGEQLGKQQGEMTVLHRQLEKRFGTLPQWAETRLAQATLAELEQWSLQIFDATRLEDIFKT
jgi:predicted transposase YdaD